MSKTAKKPTTNQPNDPLAGYSDAEDFIKPDGYWKPEAGPVHGVLQGAYEYTQKSGRGRGELRRVYLVKLLAPCVATVKTEAANGKTSLDETELSRGDLCALFDAAGLRSLSDLQGCAVHITRGEKKELPNGNTMWLYSVKFKGERKPLKVRQAFEPRDDAGPSNGVSEDFEAPF